ncbi:MAG: mucoidy inhibitor MuiA family protein [Opitutaceae bacterium]|nr:mucoidy inhibitor MuiA family protein [Opitutaceae bacterium]
MKSLSSLLVAFFVALSSAPGAAIENSRLAAATVFTDRARVEREAMLDLPAGESEWTWERLPASLLDDSVRVSGAGESAVTILDATVRSSHVAAATDPRVSELEAAIEKEKGVQLELAEKSENLEKQRLLLQGIEQSVTTPVAAKDGVATRLAPEDWQRLLSFSEEQREKFSQRELALKEEKTKSEARLAALRAQLMELKGRLTGDRVFKTIAVRLNSAAAGKVQLRLAYTVDGASWQPRYDVRLNSKTRQVDVGYLGIVRQTTGEDWKGVALTLSTARPGLGGAAPELSPWWVQVVRPRPMAANASDETNELTPFSIDSARDRGYAAKSTLAGSRVQMQEASAPVALVSSQATSASFRIAAPATVLSDNSAQRVSIAQIQVPAELLYQAAPKLQETAFLTGTVTNSSEYPLLAGAANVFLDDAFVATSFLRTVMPKEKFDLSLGADEGILIKRRVVARFEEDTGLTSKGRRVTYEFVTTVTNQKATTEKVVVREAVPLSQDEKIAVKLATPSEREIGTAEKPREIMREADGKLAWTFTLKPGEKRELPLKFSIEWPADADVVGIE